MESERTRKVRERAYHLWVASGHRDDHADQHWLQAEREVAAGKPGKDAKAKTAKPAAGTKTAKANGAAKGKEVKGKDATAKPSAKGGSKKAADVKSKAKPAPKSDAKPRNSAAAGV